VLAEGLSPLRNYANLQPHLITTYDKILRDPELAQSLQPEIVIRIGEMPTSKVLREWLTKFQPQTWIISESSRSIDPLHGRSQHFFTTIEHLKVPLPKGDLGGSPHLPPTDYRQTWSIAEQTTRYTIDQTLNATPQLLESKVAWLLSQTLPQNSQIFISNSMPVRDVEYFWQPNDRHIRPYFNRGANGIDGTLSTALGVAHYGQPTVLLTGDLALLHDTNGFLIRQYFQGSLTIVLINNNGGGIFGMLPIAQFDPPFEEFFSTPQNINFAHLCQTYEIGHTIIQDWQHFEQCLSRIATNGIRILEINTDRHHDTQWRKQFFQNPLSKPS
jgi:2-succinyl-5-enolpyruvyl-6-hydroxy-3-cyclohexene-1-carboxylate synthase